MWNTKTWEKGPFCNSAISDTWKWVEKACELSVYSEEKLGHVVAGQLTRPSLVAFLFHCPSCTAEASSRHSGPSLIGKTVALQNYDRCLCGFNWVLNVSKSPMPGAGVKPRTGDPANTELGENCHGNTDAMRICRKRTGGKRRNQKMCACCRKKGSR